MLIVITPATTTRLTTLDTVRARYGITVQQADDIVVGALIDTASQMAVDFCNRGFARETVRQAERCGHSRIKLERAPASAIQVAENGSVVPSDGYYLDAASNVLWRLNGDGAASWSGLVEITYDAGWILPGEDDANLPASIEHAVLLLIGALWSAQERAPGVKSESVEGIGRTDYWVPGQGNRLPDPTAEIMLQPYRKYFV